VNGTSKRLRLGGRRKLTKGPVKRRPARPGSRRNAYLRVAESIRLRILAGDLKPGDRLPNENDLARDEGVGRTTVREALRLLASAGLIETKRGVRGGAFVTHPTAEDLDDVLMTALSLMAMSGELGDEELGEATAPILPTIANIAALRGTDEEAERLVGLAALIGETRTDDEWIHVGQQFNTLLVQMTRNRLMAMFVKPLMWISPARYRGHRLVPGWREETAVRFQALADAIRRHAPTDSEQAMVRLLQQYRPLGITKLSVQTGAV
jgi:GntR family transcriptional regulator, transcriptional repressor for pyruvate dehydrogenase complex